MRSAAPGVVRLNVRLADPLGRCGSADVGTVTLPRELVIRTVPPGATPRRSSSAGWTRNRRRPAEPGQVRREQDRHGLVVEHPTGHQPQAVGVQLGHGRHLVGRLPDERRRRSGASVGTARSRRRPGSASAPGSALPGVAAVPAVAATWRGAAGGMPGRRCSAAGAGTPGRPGCARRRPRSDAVDDGRRLACPADGDRPAITSARVAGLRRPGPRPAGRGSRRPARGRGAGRW